jgi:hypothetical protein
MGIVRYVRGIFAVAIAGSSLALVVATSAHAAAPTSGRFTQLPPTRIVDTRSGLGAPKGALDGETLLKIQVAGAGGVAPDASAVAVNLTIVAAVRPGFVTLWGQPGQTSAAIRPNASNLNVGAAGQTVANMTMIALSSDGSANLYVNSGGHVLIDVAGFWTPATTSTSGRYTAITPFRTLDTRGGPKVPPGGFVDAKVTGFAGIPDDAAAVAVAITATDATGPGFITAWAAGAPMPDASNLNLPDKGATIPNLAIVPVGAGGKISLFTSGGTHIIADVAGWFTGASAPSSNDGLFVPIEAERIVDTRNGSGGGFRRLSAELAEELLIAGRGNVPGSGVAAVAINLTITNPLDDGFLTASPSGVSVPNASNVNFSRGQTVAGLAFTRLGANGAANLFSFASTNVIADVSGYFTGPPSPDEGVHPTRCENLMQVTRDDGSSNSVLLRDRTGHNPDITIASGVSDGNIAPTCDYIAVVSDNSDNSQRIERYSFAGRKMNVIAPSVDYTAITISANGHYVFTAEGIGANGLARYVYLNDAYTGARGPIVDMKANIVWGIDLVDRTSNFLRVGAVSATTPFADYLVPSRGGSSVEISPEQHPSGRFLQQIVAPNSAVTATLTVDANNLTATAKVCSASCYSIASAESILFTPQDELVAMLSSGSAVIYKPATSSSTALPLAANEIGISFPTYALGPISIFGV